MHLLSERVSRRLFGWTLAGVTLLAWTTPGVAQVRVGTGGGGFGGNSFGGGGSFGGNSLGGTSFGGGSLGGTTFGGASGGSLGSGSSSFTGISASNPFGAYYANPMAAGLPSTTGMTGSTGGFSSGAGGFSSGAGGFSSGAGGFSSGAGGFSSGAGGFSSSPGGRSSGGTARTSFGTPLYGLSTTSTGTIGGLSTGATASLGGFQGAGSASSATNLNFSPSSGARSSIPYVAVPAFSQTAAAPSKLLDEVRQVLSRSSSLPSKGNLRVGVENQTVVLQGLVSDDHERRLAEYLVRLTPGVHEVRNELDVPRP